MKSFEAELRKRMRSRIIFAVCVGVVFIAAFIVKGVPADDWETSVLLGLLIGAELSAARYVAKCRRALKNPEVLEQQHIRETDERNRVIILRTCRAAIRQTLNVLWLAAVVAVFFNRTVYWTLIAVIALVVGLYYALFAYYLRKS